MHALSKGINQNGKRRERAKREAEEHRCHPSAVPIEQPPHGTEESVAVDLLPATSGVHRSNETPYASPIENPNVVASNSPFIPPTIPQASFEVFRMPCYPSSEASTSTSEVGESPGMSPFHNEVSTSFPFPRLPSLEELALPQPLVVNALGARPWDTEFVLQEGLSHTPPESALGEDMQEAMSNHTMWSHNWFGCDNLDQGPGIASPMLPTYPCVSLWCFHCFGRIATTARPSNAPSPPGYRWQIPHTRAAVSILAVISLVLFSDRLAEQAGVAATTSNPWLPATFVVAHSPFPAPVTLIGLLVAHCSRSLRRASVIAKYQGRPT